MSIRTVLIGTVVLVTLATALVLGSLAVRAIRNSVQEEAQQRVNHDMGIASALYEQRLDLLAEALGSTTSPAETVPGSNELATLRQRLNFTVLNLCDVEGRPIAGTYPDHSSAVPIRTDPVLRKALEGALARGTMLLSADRLAFEGGPALHNAMTVIDAKGDTSSLAGSALFWWAARPIHDVDGRVVGLLYGGRALNHHYEFVDEIRGRIFGPERHEGKPLGTVTVFLKDLRVATNVIGPDGRRAVGTHVSEVVRHRVLADDEPYYGRAWVVDAWYLSGYLPLRDPNGSVIGMLYVGLLEAPYSDLERQLIVRFLVPAGIILLVAGVAAVLIVRQITRPIGQLSKASERLAEGHWDQPVSLSSTYVEFTRLADAFERMQTAIQNRDRELRDKNDALAVSNERLAQINRNYMEMLGFVTHELKSPLAAMQMTIGTILGGYLGEVPEKIGNPLIRVQRNCEELQDMVKNYLDMSRAERGELMAQHAQVNLRTEVVDPCISQAESLLRSRGLQFELVCPDTLEAWADPELMRIALNNYLSNAAKYGREGGRVKLVAQLEEVDVKLTVWNEGTGFTEEEGKTLFGKFARLKNKNTRDKKGSGLGLFLCRQVAEQHGGSAWAESEPGQWALFGIRFPREAPADEKTVA